MRFLIDAQLPPGFAVHLTRRGFYAEHVNRIGLGAASDRAIWEYAVHNRSILVTKDEDFVALARRTASGAQVIWIRVGNITNDALWRMLDPLWEEIVGAIRDGEEIVEIV